MTERAERAKARRRSAIEQQELEAAKKRKLLNESGTRVVSIDFPRMQRVLRTEMLISRKLKMYR